MKVYENCECCEEGCRGCPDLATINVTFNCGTNGIKNRTIPQCTNCADYCTNGPYVLDYISSTYIEGLGCVDEWEGQGETCSFGGSHTHWLRLSIEFFDEATVSDATLFIYADSSKSSLLATWSVQIDVAPNVWDCSETLPDLTTISQQLGECQWSLSTSTSNNPTVTITP